jgi:hypothetical protein
MVAEGAGDPQPVSEAGRLAAESAEAFRAAEVSPNPTDKAEKLEAAQDLAGDAALAAAYRYLQIAVGIIAILLPFVVVAGNYVFGSEELLGSISAYYYTAMGSWFVGSLFALAVFFLSYNYRPLPSFELDNWLSRVACAAALGVALFPTTSDAATASGTEKFVGTLHLVCAGILFGMLAVFSYLLFTKSDKATVTLAKKRRNRLYRTCGVVIAASMVLVGVSNLVEPPSSWHALLVLETVMVVAFGVSWLVKGGFLRILADKPRLTAGN